MLTDALMKLKEALTKPDEIQPEILVPTLAKEYNVSEDDMILYYNFLADAKRLREEKDVKGWLTPEEHLVYHFVSKEMSNGAGIHKAVDDIASVLGRKRGGVQTKYYEIRKKIEETTKENSVELKETKVEKNSHDTFTSHEKDEPTQSENIANNVEEKPEPNKINEENSAPVAQNSVPAVETNQQVTSSEAQSKTEGKKHNRQKRGATPVVEQAKETEPVEELDVVTLVNRLISNMDAIGKEDATFDSNGLLVDLLRGLFVLSEVAAKNLTGGLRYQEAERRAEMLEKENQTLMEDVRANAELVHQKNEELRQLYENMQERVDEFENLDPKEKLAGISKYHSTIKYQLNKYTELSLVRP